MVQLSMKGQVTFISKKFFSYQFYEETQKRNNENWLVPQTENNYTFAYLQI